MRMLYCLIPFFMVIHQQQSEISLNKEAMYEFRYSVDAPSSGVVHDRWESRQGDYVKGAYSLLDPDGKIRTVHYEVDGKRGYRAVVEKKWPGSAVLLHGFRILKKHNKPIVYEKPVGKIKSRDLLDPHRN